MMMLSVPRHPFARRLRELADALDDISIDIGHYHVSLLNALWMIWVVLAALAFALVAARMARHVIRGIKGLDPAQLVLGEKLITLIVWTFTSLITIDALGISFTALTVFSGAFGLAIGFGLQKTLGNMIAGILLLLDRSIKPGDVIAVNDGKGNTFGEVKKIGLRAISVTTRENREYLIPNEILMTSQVENWSYSSREVTVSIPISVAYDTDLDLAERLLIEAASAAPRVLASPPPGVMLTALGPGAIEMLVYCWIGDPELGIAGVRSDVLKGAWRLFQTHGITIPFPQQDLSLRDSEGLRALAEALRRESGIDRQTTAPEDK